MALQGVSGKVAVVTGAARGIGAATVARLAREGCRVMAVDMDHAELSASISGLDPEVVRCAAADVSVPNDCDRYVQECCNIFGQLDYLVNNAGILGATAPLTELSVENFDRVMAVNARGVMLGMRAAVRQFMAQQSGGAIVNVTSVGAFRANPRRLAYAASKAAVIALTKGACHDVGEHGIRINAVAPGATRTPMAQQVQEARAQSGSRAEFKARPISGMAEPQEVAGLIAWLLSDEARYVTGAVYTIDGGITA